MKNYFKICLAFLVFFLMTACAEESPMQVQSRPESGEHHIPVEISQKRLSSIIKRMNGGQATRSGIDFSEKKVTSVVQLDADKQPLTRGSGEAPAYYVFRFGENEGFAIMSADDRLPELLAIGEGVPNPYDATSDIPDSSMWTLPTVSDTTAYNSEYPIPDVTDIDRPCTYMHPIGLVSATWGQGAPFSDLYRTLRPLNIKDYVELRVPADVVAVAQLLTSEKGHSFFRYNDTFINSLDWDRLSKCKHGGKFLKDTAMYRQVNELYFEIMTGYHLYPGYNGNISYDPIKKIWYAEMCMDYTSGVDSPGTEKYNYYNGYMEWTLSTLEFGNTQLQKLTDAATIEKIIEGLGNKDVAIFQDLETYNQPFKCHKVALIDNVMCFDEVPNIKYFRVNHGKDGIGNGYYLTEGFVGNVMYRQPTKDRGY